MAIGADTAATGEVMAIAQALPIGAAQVAAMPGAGSTAVPSTAEAGFTAEAASMAVAASTVAAAFMVEATGKENQVTKQQ
jgi:hypothetical protein